MIKCSVKSSLNIGNRTTELMKYKILYQILGDNRCNRLYNDDRAIRALFLKSCQRCLKTFEAFKPFEGAQISESFMRLGVLNFF